MLKDAVPQAAKPHEGKRGRSKLKSYHVKYRNGLLFSSKVIKIKSIISKRTLHLHNDSRNSKKGQCQPKLFTRVTFSQCTVQHPFSKESFKLPMSSQHGLGFSGKPPCENAFLLFLTYLNAGYHQEKSPGFLSLICTADMYFELRPFYHVHDIFTCKQPKATFFFSPSLFAMCKTQNFNISYVSNLSLGG